MLSQLQLERAALERLGQGRAPGPVPGEAPDFIFYTGCNVLRTPHIALLALDIMDTLGISYRSMGGPSHCCGVTPSSPSMSRALSRSVWSLPTNQVPALLSAL